MSFQLAASLDELWSGEAQGVVVAGVKVLLLRLGDDVYAYADRCAHRAYPLSKGALKGGRLVCRAHEWEFDGRTGRGVNPESACLTAFAVELRGRDIFVDTEARHG